MTTTLRPDISSLPLRMKKLPLDRGYPVPWFAPFIDGKAEFRAMDPRKLVTAIKQKVCWVCGEPLGQFKSFVIGPMCVVNRNTAEPPCHLDCATFSARNCPFLARPHAKRREDDFTRELQENTAGIALTRNPGVAAVWTTKFFELYDDGKGKPLFYIGEPNHVEWYCEGRDATREEVEESIRTGLPALEQLCEQESSPERCLDARAQLAARYAYALQYLPAHPLAAQR